MTNQFVIIHVMSQEQRPEESVWDGAFEDVDFSPLDKGREDEYPTIPPNEISEAYETYPLKGVLMRLANDNLREARAQAEGTKPREKTMHDDGWKFTIETPQGMVGLWSSWIGNRFYLGFPKSTDMAIEEELIMRTLGVERAKPVRQVNATAVMDWNYKGEYADPDKPLEGNSVGQIIGYQDAGDRQWAKFYGPIEPTGGRVWIDCSGFSSSSVDFPYIDGDGQLQSLYYGHDNSNGISTEQFSFYNQYAPEGPTADPEAIQKYRDKFIRLVAEIAYVMGGPRAINIDYGYSLVPEDLSREGYEDITWLKGYLGERQGWGNEVVRGKKGDSTVILKSGNSLVPWSTTLRVPIGKSSSPALLTDFIKEDILWF